MRDPRYTGNSRALHLQNLGIRLLTVSYCCIGALLGQFIRGALPGRPTDWSQDRLDLLAFALLGNFLGLYAMVEFFRRRAAEPPLESFVHPLEVIIRGLPASNRVAFILFTLAWLVGIILGMALTVS
jgi:hypothetical protein